MDHSFDLFDATLTRNFRLATITQPRALGISLLFAIGLQDIIPKPQQVQCFQYLFQKYDDIAVFASYES